MLPELPEDIIIEILYHLPAISLLKFKCVSKSWHSLISSEKFSKEHLVHSKKKTRLMLLAGGRLVHCPVSQLLSKTKSTFKQPTYTCKPATSPVCDELDSLFGSSRLENYSHGCQSDGPGRGFKLVGSCDGLILLVSVLRGQLVLWNPATRTHRIIPTWEGYDVTSSTYFNNPCNYSGFGLGFVNGDYKVLALLNWGAPGDRFTNHPPARVYSLRANEWKIVNAIPPTQTSSVLWRIVVFGNGKFYWANCLSSCGLDGVHCLDVETEDYREISIPDHDQIILQFHMAISEEKSPCFVYIMYCHQNNATLWMLDASSLWKMLCNVDYHVVTPWGLHNCFIQSPFLVLSNGDIMIWTWTPEAFSIFSPKDPTLRRIADIRLPVGIDWACSYVESFVSL